MTVRQLDLLECDGVHGCHLMSSSSPIISRELDGWTTVRSYFDDPNSPVTDLCPSCSVQIWISKMFEIWHGYPDCGWAMDNNREDLALFAWDLLPDNVHFRELERLHLGRTWSRV